jgi:hypothetical protein
VALYGTVSRFYATVFYGEVITAMKRVGASIPR